MATAPRSVWITRTEPGTSMTAARVRALGHEAILEPVLEVRAIAEPLIDMTDVCALAFTSANAVRAFTEHSQTRHIRVFAVGEATGAAARAARFKTVLTAHGDVDALASALIARRREFNGVVLHPGAAEPAGDLVGALTKAGVPARAATLYETVPIEPSAALLERLAEIDLALLHSPKAARRLVDILKQTPAPQLVACCLSRAVSRPLSRAGLAEVRVAAPSTESALLELIGGPAAKPRRKSR